MPGYVREGCGEGVSGTYVERAHPSTGHDFLTGAEADVQVDVVFLLTRRL